MKLSDMIYGNRPHTETGQNEDMINITVHIRAEIQSFLSLAHTKEESSTIKLFNLFHISLPRK